MDHNKITQISNKIYLLSQLQTLSLAYNEIRVLPVSMKELRYLKDLNLNVNYLEYFDD
jgi:Leucine-rich repeat (LRR) protein